MLVERSNTGTSQLRSQPAVNLPWMMVLLLIILGATLRFYRLHELMLFLGDQARDANVVRNMIETGNATLVGPASSVGGFHRGPIYYYLLLPAFILGQGNPASGAAFIGLVDLAAIVMLFLVGRKFFSDWAALVAAALWTSSPMLVIYARWLWNPNLLPFFVLIMMYSFFQIAHGKDRYMLLLAPTWFVAWQLHDEALLLLPVFAVFALWFRPRITKRRYIHAGAFSLLILAPYLIDEFLHHFQNTGAMLHYLLSSITLSKTGGFLSTAFSRLSLTFRVLDAAVIPGSGIVHIGFQLLIVAGLVALLMRVRETTSHLSATVFFLWGMTPFLYAFWPDRFAPQYLEILFPPLFLLLGLGVEAFRRLHRSFGIAAMVLVLLFVSFQSAKQLIGMQVRQVGPGTLGATESVVKYIVEQTKGNPYAFRLVSSFQGFDSFDMPYLYLFGLLRQSPSKRADVDTYVVYDPCDFQRGPIEKGPIINGVKVVRLPSQSPLPKANAP